MPYYQPRGGIFDSFDVQSMVEAGPSERVPQTIRPRVVGASYGAFGSVMSADPMRPMPIGHGRAIAQEQSGIFQRTWREPSGRQF